MADQINIEIASNLDGIKKQGEEVSLKSSVNQKIEVPVDLSNSEFQKSEILIPLSSPDNLKI